LIRLGALNWLSKRFNNGAPYQQLSKPLSKSVKTNNQSLT